VLILNEPEVYVAIEEPTENQSTTDKRDPKTKPLPAEAREGLMK
jgi:hypothetical protein